MINKSELMLGNLIKDEPSGEWMEVDNVGAVLSANILNKSLDPMPDTVYMVPIPITRAGLLHIGFEMVEGGIEPFHRFNTSEPPPMERPSKDPKKSYKYHLACTLRGLYEILPLIVLIVLPPIVMTMVTGNKFWIFFVVITLPAGIALSEYMDANEPSK